MTRHLESERLQDLREGLLSAEEEDRVRAHLETCPRCRTEMEDLTDLLDGLAALPGETDPSRDLWPQIAWRIGAGSGGLKDPGASEDALSPAQAGASSSRTFRSRIAIPVWQLLAAGIVVALVSGGSVWALFSSGGSEWGGNLRGPGAASAPAQARLAGWDEAYNGYDNAMADLEGVLRLGRDVLDPETVRVLEENLKTIDEAIAEARAALDQDPASPVLQRILAENLRKRLGFLRLAVSAVYANT